MRATMKMPAVTMVAAWISAEIGVGPSIESGSQTCSGNCALLPIAPTNRHRADQRHRRRERGRLREHLRVVERAEVRQHQADAEEEAEVAHPVDEEGLQVRVDRASGRVYQKPISR